MVTYKLNKISLVPDKYGHHLKIGMVTAIDGHGKYIKHVKINNELVSILKEGFLLPSEIQEEDTWE